MLGLAERFGQPPEAVYGWDASVLRLLRLEAMGERGDQAQRLQDLNDEAG